jgi:putative FmdB family regulatory protein
MPVYEYACRKCHHEFEELVFGDEKPVCPKCKAHALEKKFSVFGTQGEASGMPESAPPGCGTCGDPRGPGACNLN